MAPPEVLMVSLPLPHGEFREVMCLLFHAFECRRIVACEKPRGMTATFSGTDHQPRSVLASIRQDSLVAAHPNQTKKLALLA